MVFSYLLLLTTYLALLGRARAQQFDESLLVGPPLALAWVGLGSGSGLGLGLGLGLGVVAVARYRLRPTAPMDDPIDRPLSVCLSV